MKAVGSCFARGYLLGAMQSVPRLDVRVGSYSSHQPATQSRSEMSDAVKGEYAEFLDFLKYSQNEHKVVVQAAEGKD